MFFNRHIHLSTAMLVALACMAREQNSALAVEPASQNVLLKVASSTTLPTTQSESRPLGHVVKVETNGRELLLKCENAAVRVNFWSDQVVRMQVSKDGSFAEFDDTKAFMIQPGIAAFKGVAPKATQTDDTVRLATGSVVMEISKKPFGFRFFRSDGTSLLAEGTLDAGPRASFKQDACGKEEHYFGLQNEHDSILDHRGRSVPLQDKNGAGWSAPFVMSTAGYGLFLNNEESKNTVFSFNQPVVLENTAGKGPMDLFFIVGGELKEILATYMGITGMPGMPPRKLLGFQYLVQGTHITNEEKFGEWIKRGYPIDSCITFTDQQVEEPADIEALAATAQRIHQQHGSFGFYYDVVPMPGTFKKTKPEPMTRPYEGWDAFKKLVKTRLLDNGVDWFWIDETDGGFEPRFKHNLYTALKEVQEAQDNRRSFNCARGGYAGTQRFGYPWMGDVHYDRKAIIMNLCNGLAGFPSSTHDMCGASLNGQTDAMFLNGVKCNLLNPLSQCNAWIPAQKKTHRPWEWTPEVEQVFKKYLDLHYQLIPYFYTTAWQSTQTGLPSWRALVLDHPGDAATYSSDEVMIGDWMLMAPLYREPARPVYLPQGNWYYLFDSACHFTGPTYLSGVQPPPSEYPLFVKAGAIIPMMPPMQYVGEKAVDPLTLLVYPLDAGTSSYTLYEDDGETRDYQSGKSCTTRIECIAGESQVRIVTRERSGLYHPAKRSRLLSVFQAAQPGQVTLNGKALPACDTREKLDAAAEGWGYFQDSLTGVKRVFVKTADEGHASEIAIARSPVIASTEKPALTPTFDNSFSRQYDKVKTVAPKVAFVKEDRDTSGSWRGAYGKSGYLLQGIGKRLPDRTDVQISGQVIMWDRNAKEPRALQRENGEERTAAGNVARDVFVDVVSDDPKPRKITLFLLDWEGHTAPARLRATEVAASNPLTGAIYDLRNVESMHNGVYLTYEVTGSVSFILSRVKGHTAAISGLFFDE